MSLPAPHAAEKTAAEFLQRVISLSVGVTLPITETEYNPERAHCIFIGTHTSEQEIQWDGYCISTDERNLYLHGNIPRGTLYAAHSFAEQYLGYRLFSYDTEGISTEGDSAVPKGFRVIDNPVIEVRRCSVHGLMNHPHYAAFSRINANISCGLGEEWGGTVYDTVDCHTFHKYCPPQEYFAAHPEYYALRDGKRIPCNTAEGPGQLCLTHPDVIRIVTENVLRELRANPETRLLDLSQCDNSNYCECERCTAVDEEEGSHSGTMIRFVNAVAEAVEKEFPNVLIQTFAYQYSRKAPKLTKARPNVIIRYCTIEACMRHALNDPACEYNREFDFVQELSDWREKADKLSIWDYITNYRCLMAPFPNLPALRENMRLFADCHAIHLYEADEASPASGVYPDLKAYLTTKLLWNPYMSDEEYFRHRDEFLQAFYGPGWREILRYMELELETTHDQHMDCMTNIDLSCLFKAFFPEVHTYLLSEYQPKPYQPIFPESPLNGLIARLPEALECFERALSLAETELQRMHLERSRVSLTYLKLFCIKYDRASMTEEERADYEAACDRLVKEKERFGLHYNLWTLTYNKR